jgi:hypothetical protein
MFRKALIMLLIVLPVLAMGCSSPSATPTAAPQGVTATPSAGSSPTATPAAGPAILYNETTIVPAGGYATYKVTLDYQKMASISIKTDGAPVDCIVMYDSALQDYKDTVAGTKSYFGFQKLYPNIIDATNTYTSYNDNQAYYIVLDNSAKAGDANAGRDVSVHIKVEQL